MMTRNDAKVWYRECIEIEGNQKIEGNQENEGWRMRRKAKPRIKVRARP
jgi:hypothetical protein